MGRRRCTVSSWISINNQPRRVTTVDAVLTDLNDADAGFAERSDVALATFLSNSPACRVAASALKSGAEVGLVLTDVEGDWRLWNDPENGIVLAPGKAKDCDFQLRIPPRAVFNICSHSDADMGDLGVLFFEHIVARDPARKIHVTLHSGLVKLTGRGWLGLLARGGPKVLMWMTKHGLRGPSAIATALGRLKR
jgi:hypothetical protein